MKFSMAVELDSLTVEQHRVLTVAVRALFPAEKEKDEEEKHRKETGK